MASPLTMPAATAAPLRPARSRRRWRVLAIALVGSLALHLAVTLWPVDVDDANVPTVLTATITEVPPPPAPAVATPSPAPKPARPRKTSPLLPLDPSTVAAPSTPDVAPLVDVPNDATMPIAELPPVLAETQAPSAPPTPPSIKTLPSRVELAYRVYYGVGVYIGDASYRFEHANGRYKVETVGEARGLAALVLRGQGKVEVRGLITPAGLQPWELSVERGSSDRREVATFDWESGIATLHDDKTGGARAADVRPAVADVAVLLRAAVAGRPVVHAGHDAARVQDQGDARRERRGRVAVRAGRGRALAPTSDDGRTESVVWLAPSLRYLPIKMRVTNTLRGTIEVVLAAIRVDDGNRVE
jgi:hypothetical protein